jgi:hypothetical protein
MGSKLYKGDLTVLKFKRDFAANPLAQGTAKLGDLPTGFVIQSLRANIIGTLTASSTIALGEDGAGDADGYLVAVDPAASQRGEGALLYNGTDKRPLEYVVPDATDGLLLTIAGADAAAGVLEVFVVGYQS